MLAGIRTASGRPVSFEVCERDFLSRGLSLRQSERTAGRFRCDVVRFTVDIGSDVRAFGDLSVGSAETCVAPLQSPNLCGGTATEGLTPP